MENYLSFICACKAETNLDILLHLNRFGLYSPLLAAGIIYFMYPELNAAENWWLGISPEGIGTVGMILNFVVANIVSSKTPPPPPEIQALVERVRIPRESKPEVIDM